MSPAPGSSLLSLRDAVPGLVTLFVLVLCRVSAALFTMPMFAELLPRLVRIGTSILLSIVGFASLPPTLPPSLKLSSLLVAVGYELLIGVMLGLSVRLFAAAFESAGQMVGLQLGLGFSGMLDPIQQEESLVTSRLISTVAWLGFVAFGGVEQLFGGLIASLNSHALGTPPALALDGWLDLMNASFALAVRLGVPIIAGMTLVQLTLALVGRALTELNPYSLSFAAMTLLGLWLLVPMLDVAHQMGQATASNALSHWTSLLGQTR